MAIAPGTAAPDFSLKTMDDDGMREVKLSDQFGQSNTVILFFPAAFTSVCTDELCDVTNGLGQFEAANAKVFGISADTPFAQKAWKEQNKIGVTLLSDYGRQAITAYGVELPDFAGTGGTASQRAVFVIDKEGKVAYSEVTENPGMMPKMDALREAVKNLG